jgi:hypothetical protein
MYGVVPKYIVWLKHRVATRTLGSNTHVSFLAASDRESLVCLECLGGVGEGRKG